MQNFNLPAADNQMFDYDENYDCNLFSSGNPALANAPTSVYHNNEKGFPYYETSAGAFGSEEIGNKSYQHFQMNGSVLQTVDINQQTTQVSGSSTSRFEPFEAPHCSQQPSQDLVPNIFFPIQAPWSENYVPTPDHTQFQCKWMVENPKDCWMTCNAILSNLKELAQHLNCSHIKKEGKANYPCRWENCNRCIRPFKERSKLEAHLRTHTGEKPFTCEYCKKPFARSENLLNHRRTHTGEKPFSCSFPGCPRMFGNSSDKKKHLDTHSTTKKYKCQKCERAYKHISSFRKHNCMFADVTVPNLPRI